MHLSSDRRHHTEFLDQTRRWPNLSDDQQQEITGVHKLEAATSATTALATAPGLLLAASLALAFGFGAAAL